ncbi:MAG: sialate O-acetylesterase [Saprospiraceae bacterium]|nr:sialate O-acetylesterase [Saprospiraceae bacterium]
MQLFRFALCGLVLFIFGATTSVVLAQMKLPAILSDNMCIQQNTEVKIWGWDDPGQSVEVRPSWTQESSSTVVTEGGNWQVEVKTPVAGGPYTIAIEGSTSASIKNILVGDVWVCSGQSNMDRKLGMQPRQKPIVNFWEAAQHADLPNIRLFVVERAIADLPQEDLQGKWVVCTPETVLEFSAVGYFFAHRLQQDVDMPLGMIESSWGGTPVEAWTRKDALQNSFLVDKEESKKARFTADSFAFAANVQAFDQGFLNEAPTQPESFHYKRAPHHHIGSLYNAMIHPLLNFAITGAIWYQGESNRGHPKIYAKQFPTMIENWRAEWAVGDFPFYFVQIAPYYYNGNFGIPPLWEAQEAALALPNTGMASTQDIGQIYDIHPPEKEEVGRRLALLALEQHYETDGIVSSGPQLADVTFKDGKAVLTFDAKNSTFYFAGDGIGGIPSFFVADQRRIFYPAEVKQQNNRLILSANGIQEPVAVRYLWNDKANATIYNMHGLPTPGFRTDNWDDALMME